MKVLPPVSFASVFSRFLSTIRQRVRIPAAVSIALTAIMLVLAASASQAQVGRAGLISQAVNDDRRVTLTGNRHPLATRAADRGAVDASMPADRMLLLLRRSPEQELALQAAIQAMHDQNSPNFHKWLTPQQFGAQWGAVDSDIAAVTAWLQSHGFRVTGPTAAHTAIEFSGTAGQIEEAFHTSIHNYLVNGEMHHANASDPEIPEALAPVVSGILSLNDFRPKAMYRKAQRGVFDSQAQTIRPVKSDSNGRGLHPEYTDPTGFLYLVAADAATIYNTPNHALNPNYTGAPITGTGAKIGIIGDSDISTVQPAHYRTLFGLPPQNLTVIVDGTHPGVNGDELEAYLDIEVANALAPSANIYFYTAANTTMSAGFDLAIMRAVNDDLVDVISASIGACEGFLTTANNQFYEGEWEQAATQGISVTVSAGDSGSAGCDDFNTQTEANYGLQVNGLASTPYNIAVGGTDFYPLFESNGFGSDSSDYVSLTDAPGTYRSARRYIPENPWNDTSFTFPPVPYTKATPAPDPYANIVGGSGGKSNCSRGYLDSDNNLVCQGGYAKPSWQAAPGVPAASARYLPDVSLFAADGLYGGAWGICTDQDELEDGTPITDCTPGSDGLPAHDFYVTGLGGTSAAAPAFAGILALVRQSTGERQGQANYALYNLARTNPAVFHDITVGNNSVPCAKGTTDCNLNTEKSYYLSGYNATPGYDLASGLGSMDVAAMIQAWSTASLTATTTTLSVSPIVLQHGKAVNLRAAVATGGGVATGEVAIISNSVPPLAGNEISIGTYPLLSNGMTGTVSVKDLPGGSYNLTATYSGSAKYSVSSSAPQAVTVSPEPTITTFTFDGYNPTTSAESGSTTQSYGFPVNFRAYPYGVNSASTLHPDGIATGTVRFTTGSEELGAAQLGADGSALSVGHLLPVGKYTIKASYLGDKSFDPSLGGNTLTVVKAVTSLTLTASTTKYTGAPIVFQVNVTTNSSGEAPKGVVSLRRGSTVLVSEPIEARGATSSALAEGSVTFTTNDLGEGPTPITAVYGGDGNYEASTSDGIAIAGKPTFTIANTSVTLFGQRTTGGTLVTVVSVGGYSGTVNFTCRLTTAPKGVASPPECAMYPNTEKLAVGGTARPAVLIFGKGTKLPTGVTESSNAGTTGLKFGTGATVLACCLLLGIPARRRGWKRCKSLAVVLLMLVAAGGFTACVTTPKFITSGQYTFAVTGSDSTDATNTATAKIAVTVY